MGDIKQPWLIYLKGLLFLVLGLFASVVLVMHAPSLTVVALLALAVWAFCRFYYFAFYVIEHYVDPTYKFAGLWSFMRYAMRRRREEPLEEE